jgi:hypothetical protein
LLHRILRRHVQRAHLAASAQSRRGAQRHRRGVLLLRGRQACVRG